MKKILILVAMQSEFDLVKLNLVKNEFKLEEDNTYFKNNVKIYLVKTGVGKVLSSIIATESVLDIFPDTVFNVGYCGATCDMSDMVTEISKVVNKDFDTLAVDGAYNEDSVFISNVGNVLYTQDHFETNRHTQSGYYDMEGFSIAKVCERYSRPFYILKIVSDIIGEDNQLEQYFDNSKQVDSVISKLFEKISQIEKKLE